MDIENKIIGHIKRSIADLQEENGLFELPEESIIIQKISKLKDIPKEILGQLFDVNIDDVEKINWDNVKKTLLEEVMVKYEPGKGLIDDSEEYDKKWFSKLKITDKFDQYYTERFNDFYKDKLGPQVRYTLSRDTESILNLCGSPKRESVKHIRGLVFGYVQSGKTLNYASVTNAAMGSGYDMIVVLAGATNILREQTQDRLNSDLIGYDSGKVIGVGKFNNNASKKPISLTTQKSDFNKKEANAQTNGINLENIRVPVIAVIKKNVTPLKNLKDWIKNQTGQGGILKKSLLLIDDESDYASVNTNEEEDPTSVNKGIRELLNSFDVSTYLAVTATPFANILINHEINNEDFGADLFPKSFIWALDKPETYVGVNETLGNSFVDVYELDKQMKKEEISNELKFVLTANNKQKFKSLPYYVKYGICRFLYDSTCLRKSRPKTDHLSMLVNISRLTDHHIQISGFIEEFRADLFKIIRNSSIDRIENKWLNNIKELAKNNLHEFNSIDEFWIELEETISKTQIFDIHQRTKISLTYEKGVKRNSILIGGLTLSRGFTVEGLITTVFIRTTKTFDALMQMGRWFGHKKHIINHLSIFTTPTIRNRFELIEESIVDLLDQIDEMIKLKLPPKEFGLNIKRHPNVVIEKAVFDSRSRQGLEVVSKEKSKSAKVITLKLSLSNRIMETVRFLKDSESIQHNHNLVVEFLNKLENDEESIRYSPLTSPSLFVDIKNKNKILGFLDVPNKIVSDFIIDFRLPFQKLSDTNAKLPIRFLAEFLNKNEDLKWDVSIVSGAENEKIKILGKEINKVKRTFELSKDGKNLKLPKNQLSIPSHEYRFLHEPQYELENRSNARNLRKTQTGKPLLLLYPINPVALENSEIDLSDFQELNLWGWSISMPGSNQDEDYISVLANTVYIKELNEDFQEELENENN